MIKSQWLTELFPSLVQTIRRHSLRGKLNFQLGAMATQERALIGLWPNCLVRSAFSLQVGLKWPICWENGENLHVPIAWISCFHFPFPFWSQCLTAALFPHRHLSCPGGAGKQGAKAGQWSGLDNARHQPSRTKIVQMHHLLLLLFLPFYRAFEEWHRKVASCEHAWISSENLTKIRQKKHKSGNANFAY